MTATTIDAFPTATTTERQPVRATSTPVAGGPRLLLRLEGALAFGAAIAAYVHLGGGWAFFAAMILVPDLSLLGYLAGPRIGAAVYNTGHSYLAPALAAVIAYLVGAPTALLCAVIWLAHVGMDRAAGYGLKYASSFYDTHLGRVGKLGHRSA